MFDNLKTKIRYLIKKLLLNFQYKNKYSITYKGSYLIQYILDVYINKTKKDYIEEYENMINSTLEKMEQRHWLENSIIRNFIKKFYLNEKLSTDNYRDIEHERIKIAEEMNDNT